MIILGIDPGINCTGWAIIQKERQNVHYIASGVIETHVSKPLCERLAHICINVGIVIDAHTPAVAAMEEVFINKNPQSSLKLSHARGAIMAAVSLKGIALSEYAPTHIKKTVVGVGRAEKEQVQHMVGLLIKGAKFKKADEADALAVAYTCMLYQ